MTSSAAVSSASSFWRVRSKIRLVCSSVIVGGSCIPGTWIVPDESGVPEWIGLLGYPWGIVVGLRAMVAKEEKGQGQLKQTKVTIKEKLQLCIQQ